MPTRFAVPLLVLALAAPGCVRDDGLGVGDRPTVVSALHPLVVVAARVGGDRVDVVDITPPGAEPHDIELTPALASSVEKADVVLHVTGLQPALDAAVRAESGLDALAIAHGDDPHVWLDPVVLAEVTEAVADRLSEIDPDGEATYRANADALVRELTALHDQIAHALARCPRRDIVTSHAAFGRFAARYGLRQTSISGIDPEAEPSPRRIAEVAAFAKKNGVTTVFAESAGDKTAQTVAREAGAKVAVLDPVEVDRGTPYVTVMGNNVTVLREALGCP